MSDLDTIEQARVLLARFIDSSEGIPLVEDSNHYIRPATGFEIELRAALARVRDVLEAKDEARGITPERLAEIAKRHAEWRPLAGSGQKRYDDMRDLLAALSAERAQEGTQDGR